jgi:amidohydrolase
MTFEDEIIEIRRYVHKNPELSGNEYNTSEFIESRLKNIKIPYKRVSKTGVIGTLKGTNQCRGSKTIALRADIDALPVYEENDIEYKSTKDGVMHACGHDGHIAIILGAARILQQKKSELKGNIRFIFQPSEESSNGAIMMINDGALKNPDVDLILGVHVNPWIKTGKIGLKFGVMMAAVDEVKIDITGIIAHGAYPHTGKDALIAASMLINMIQCIVSRELDPLESAVITFGKIEGGDSYNIICKKVTIYGTVRSLNTKTRDFIRMSIVNKLKAIEIAYKVKCVAYYNKIGDALINEHGITDICVRTAKSFYGKRNVEILEQPSMGSEDFSEYLNIVPGNYIYIGTAKNKDTSYSWHHNSFNIDEMALPKAAEYIAYTAICLLNN